MIFEKLDIIFYALFQVGEWKKINGLDLFGSLGVGLFELALQLGVCEGARGVRICTNTVEETASTCISNHMLLEEEHQKRSIRKSEKSAIPIVSYKRKPSVV
ncbi:hypothetical protein FRC16_010888 [Serendipita sp. 398]|nr:hypothetical protein FRC16_010888 [Serendipita sp. 398]